MVDLMLAYEDISSALRSCAGSLSAEEVMSNAEKGDSIALKAVRHVASAITKAIMILSVVLNPRKVVLGGPIGDSDALVGFVSDELASCAGQRDIYPAVLRCSIKPYGSALGAVGLVIDNAFHLIHEDFIAFAKQQ